MAFDIWDGAGSGEWVGGRRGQEKVKIIVGRARDQCKGREVQESLLAQEQKSRPQILNQEHIDT